MRKRRSKGATLGLVAVIALVIIVIGVAIFILVKIMGGGRELANATDAGVLNIAKKALRDPSKSAFSFSNPDVGNNFALLGENPSNLNLVVYNRLVAQSALVALNAKDEGTAAAGQHARRVWAALNEVAQYLRQNHESAVLVGQHFSSMAGSNNLKMLGNNGVGMSDNAVSFMKRGASTNIYINPTVLATVSSSSLIPINSSGKASPTGYKYFSGYAPFNVTLPATGDSLTFAGVTVSPQDRPHLVNLGQFTDLSEESFVTGMGYPAGTLPPNSFKAGGTSQESTSKTMAGAVACAMVGCLNQEYEMAIPYGYLILKNGPSAPAPPQSVAFSNDDIHHFELGLYGGIHLQGSGAGGSEMFSTKGHLFQSWADANAAGTLPEQHIIDQSFAHIHRIDGTAPSLDDFKGITSGDTTHCTWLDYDEPSPQPNCVTALPAFKSAYGRPGSTDSDASHWQANGYTVLEKMKVDLLRARSGITTCATVVPDAQPSGMKWYNVFAPGNLCAPSHVKYNFCEIKTPWDYLRMIDRRLNGSCEEYTVFQKIVKRCQQIKPSTTEAEVETLLKSKDLPLGSWLYIYASGGNLTIAESPPPWVVAGTTSDGAARSCGDFRYVYDEVNAAVDTHHSSSPGAGIYGDGGFNQQPFTREPDVMTKDEAIWTPSTGFNNLLGEVLFQNSCTGGGKYCQPN